jgi:gluconokinase
MIVLIMGVAGSGKSTVGRSLAEILECRFIEADDFHTPASREKMAAGIPLGDADREPWLDRLAEEIEAHAATGEWAVLACSALRRRYRDRLRRGCSRWTTVFLQGDPGLISARIARRSHHYMPASLLASQLATLERPGPEEQAVVLDVAAHPVILARSVAMRLRVAGTQEEYPDGPRS